MTRFYLNLDARITDLEGRFQRLYEVVNGEPTIPSRLQTLETQVHDLRVKQFQRVYQI